MATKNTPEKVTPDFFAFAVQEDGKKSYFTKIGAVFAHAKSDGFTINLSALPVDNKIVLFPPKEDEQPEPAQP